MFGSAPTAGADKPGDAIRVGIEHAEEEPVFAFFPYGKRRLRIDYGELFAVRGESQVSRRLKRGNFAP
jgi:hypothetical protein